MLRPCKVVSEHIAVSAEELSQYLPKWLEDLYIGSTNKVHLLQLVRILHQMHLVTCMYATLYSGERRPRTE